MLSMGQVLHSNEMGAEIIDHIATEMRTRMEKANVENKRKFCLLIGDSTIIIGKSIVVLCL